MDKLNMQTTNQVDENIKKIAELFPNCLTERLDENGKPEAAIDFDVAVTAIETDGTKGGGGLRVAQLFQAGIEANRSTENQSISRVKFSLPLVLKR